MQLVAYGAQDVYLTGNPQITFFKVVYRRHTNFSIETIEHSLSGSPDFGRKASITITRNGDLITKMYLKAVLGDVSAPSGYTANTRFGWCRRLGYSMIKSVELEIGGSRIDKQYGLWMNTWHELARQDDHDRGHAEMIGDTDDLTSMSAPDGEGVCKRSKTLYIPLYFWFCRNNGLALPLIAMQYHEVRVHFEFRAARDLCCYSGSFLTTPPTPTLSDASLLVDYIYLDSEERRRFAQVGHEYLIEQVQFTGEESVNNSTGKLKLAFNHPTKELVWMVQNGDFNTGKKFLSYSTDAQTLVDEAANNLALGMIQLTDAVTPTMPVGWVADGADLDLDPDAVAAGAGYTKWDSSANVTINGITWSFVGGADAAAAEGAPMNAVLSDGTAVLASGSYDLKDKIKKVAVNTNESNEIVCVTATHSLTVRDVSRPLSAWTTDNRNSWVKTHKDVVVNQHHNTGLSLDGSSNPVQKALLQLNGHNRFDEQAGAYFNYVQPFQHHTNTPADGINVYSFALDPEAHQPSGSANLSRIDNTQLNLWYADSSSTGNATADGFTHGFLNDFSKVYCYGFSYNVLRVMSGMAGLAYSN